MATPFELALQAGMSAARRLAGDSVTYSRGASTATVSNAVQTKTEFEVLDGSGVAAVVEAVEWLVAVADLPFGEPTSWRHYHASRRRHITTHTRSNTRDRVSAILNTQTQAERSFGFAHAKTV